VGALFHRSTRPESIEKRLQREFGGGYSIHVGSTHTDPFRRTFSITDLTIAADSSGTVQRTRSTFRIPLVRARGVNFVALRHGVIDIDEIELDGPRVRAFLDRNVASRHPGPKKMPHQVLMASDRDVRVGVLRIVKGDVKYSEKPLNGDHAGTFHFANMNGTVRNIGTGAAAGECVIDIRTRLADSGALKARFRYDLSSKPLKMDYRAWMGHMDATSLNELLVNLKGIRVTGGSIDSLYADISMRGDRATGTVRFPYHGLKFEMLDKNSHERDLGDKFWTFVYNQKVHDANPEDDGYPPTVVRLDRQRLPEVSLLKFVWESVREGVFRTANVPEPPRAGATQSASQ
jgi:hypothetical protein